MNKLLENVDLTQLDLDAQLRMNSETSKYGDFMNQVNDFIGKSGIDNPIKCDDKCQEDKIKAELYQKYITARENEKNASTKLMDAEKSYYTYSEGDYEYNKMNQNKYLNIGKKMEKAIEKKYLDNYTETNKLFGLLKQQSMYRKNIDALATTYGKEIDNLDDNINNLELTTNIANRKSIYFNQYNEFFNSFHKIFYWISIVATILFIIITYITKKIFTRKYQIISVVLIVSLLIPYKDILEYLILHVNK